MMMSNVSMLQNCSSRTPRTIQRLPQGLWADLRFYALNLALNLNRANRIALLWRHRDDSRRGNRALRPAMGWAAERRCALR
jgi:hypothetical protein